MALSSLVRDAIKERQDTRAQRLRFVRARRVESQYAAALRRIAAHVGDIVRGFPAGDPAVLPQMTEALRHYANVITPWARHTSLRILQEVARRDEKAWTQHTKQMSLGVKLALKSTSVGRIFRELQEYQVELIRSIPLEAARRVHHFTQEALADSTRAPSLVEEILKSGSVARSRAELIARTETSRAVTSFTQARATNLGSTHYIWRTMHDARVRESHKKMDGKVVAWNDPPTLDNLTGHAGALPNCRCFCEPILPDVT